MADLRTNFLGVKSPNPFWLASAPPTDRKVNVERAFRAGWGGVVWKTLGEAGPPVVNVSGARYGAIHGPDRRLIAMNNIELITDRDLEINLQEIKEVKRAWPDRALIVSLMVPCDEKSWKDILARVEETECDGVELNFGCPHGMSERGMGSAVGQVPEYVEMVARWCKAHTRMPVIVKLTPNITDIRQPARAAKNGGADAVSLINTINSIMNIDLDRMTPDVVIDGKGTHGGMCGPAVKPIALSMVSEIARDSDCAGLPDLGHRRHHHLARRGGVHRARRRHSAGLHRRDDLRLQGRPGDGHRPRRLYGRERLRDESRTSAAARFPRSPTGSISISITWRRPRSIRSSAFNAGAATSSARTRRIRRSSPASTASASSWSTRPNASAAISARSSARSRTASRSSTRPTASIRAPGSTMPGRPATGRRIRTIRRSTSRRRSSVRQRASS